MVQRRSLFFASGAPLLALGLSGCGLFDGGDIPLTCEELPEGCPGGDGGAGTDGGGTVTLTVEAVEPAYGSMNGGESVVVSGGPFAADAVVTFGGRTATLRTWTETELLVQSPTATYEGWVDVSVQTGQGQGKLGSAFRYFRDGEGKTGAVGRLDRIENVGQLSRYGTVASGAIRFIAPRSGADMYDVLTDAIDTCRRDYSPSLGWEPQDPGTATLRLQQYGGSGALSLTWSEGETAYTAGELSASTLTAGSIWDLYLDAGEDWPAFDLPSAVRMPAGFTLRSPDLTSTSLSLSADELAFVWSQDSSSSGVVIEVTLVEPSSGTTKEVVTCHATDDGAFTIPRSVFYSWTSGYTVYVTIARTIETVGLLPLNQADSRIVGAVGLRGALTAE